MTTPEWCTVYHYLLWGHPLLSFGVYLFWITPLCTPSIPLSHEYHYFESRECLQIFHKYQWPKTQTEYQSEKSTHVIPCLVWWNLIPSNYGLHVFSKHVWTLSTQNLAEILSDLCRFSTRWAENDYSAFFASTSKKVPPSHHHCSHPFIQKQNEEQQKTVLKNTMNYKGFHEDFIVGRHPEFLLRLVSASRVLTFCEGSTFPPYSLEGTCPPKWGCPDAYSAWDKCGCLVCWCQEGFWGVILKY